MDRAHVLEDKRYNSKWFIDEYKNTAWLNRANYVGTTQRAMRRYTGPVFWFDRTTSVSQQNVTKIRYHHPGGMEFPTGAERDIYGLLDSSP